MPHVVLFAGVATGTLYGLVMAASTSSHLPLGAGVLAGSAVGALGFLLCRETSSWAEGRPWLEKLAPLFIYLAAVVGLAGASGSRLKNPSRDNHFVYLADSLNHGQLTLRKPPPHGNDWAKVTTLTLREGEKLRGLFWRSAGRRMFRTTEGELVKVPGGNIRKRETQWYVSFPPLPSMIMMPGVALWGYDFNDIWFTLIIAALNPVLCFLCLENLRRRKTSSRTVTDNLWLTLFFCFGTVHFYCAVIGQVWYTAQIMGTTLVLGYILASLEAKHPLLGGLLLGLGFITRTPILFAAPFFLIQALRPEGLGTPPKLISAFKDIEWPRALKRILIFGVPVALVGLWMALLNELRFDNPFEFGHTYLNIRWSGRIQRWGLFNIHYLPRNLSAAFALLPHIQAKYPYVIISRHGVSLLATTPLLIYAIWPKEKSGLHHACWLSIAPMALVHFLYQNSGFVQFSYRFSLDYTPFLVLLLALSGRKLGVLAKSLLIWGVFAHTFGALSFGRWHDFYAKSNWLFVVK